MSVSPNQELPYVTGFSHCQKAALLTYMIQAIPAQVKTDIPGKDVPELTSLDNIPDYLQVSIDRLISELDKSVRLQVQYIPPRRFVPSWPLARESNLSTVQARREWQFYLAAALIRLRFVILLIGIHILDIRTLAEHFCRHIPKDEPIDLLNVAFENPRKIRVQLEGNPDALPKHQKRERKRQEQNGHATQCDTSYMVPDRLSGLEELEELRRVCPGRTWNFVRPQVTPRSGISR